MRNRIKAKRILRAFGKETYKARIAYVDSFLPEKSSYVGSISYRRALRRAVIVVLLVALIMALAVSAYAAVLHYLNYTRVVNPDNDAYLANKEYNVGDDEVVFYEPKYVPEGYVLISEEISDNQLMKTWNYRGIFNDILTIQCGPDFGNFFIDNENSTSETVVVGDIEVVIYDFGSFKLGLFQYNDTVVEIMGSLNTDEIKKIIEGMIS